MHDILFDGVSGRERERKRLLAVRKICALFIPLGFYVHYDYNAFASCIYVCAARASVCVHKCIAAVAVAATNLLNFAAIIKLGKFYVYFVLYLC